MGFSRYTVEIAHYAHTLPIVEFTMRDEGKAVKPALRESAHTRDAQQNTCWYHSVENIFGKVQFVLCLRCCF